jgi:hypothetical protein
MRLCNLFPAKLLIFACRIKHTMAGVFEKLITSHKMAMKCDPKALELETAKEILAEVFRVRLSDVDEMIQNRFEAACYEDIGSKENGLWPREFWLEE